VPTDSKLRGVFARFRLGVLALEMCPALVELLGRLQNVVQLLQCYLGAGELEMRATEEPLRSDLDAKGSRRRFSST
jgi:hypothetical protein